MEKESNFVYVEDVKNNDGKVDELKPVPDEVNNRFLGLYRKWLETAKDLSKKEDSKILLEKIASKLSNGLNGYDDNLKPAALQGGFEDMILSGIPSEFLINKILPRLLGRPDFVETYEKFSDREINEDIIGRIRGAESFSNFYNREKKEEDEWGINVSIDALHKIDAVRINKDGTIDLIQSKTSKRPGESFEYIHAVHQKYIDVFLNFIETKKEEEKQIMDKLEAKNDTIMSNLEKTENEDLRVLIFGVYYEILEPKKSKDSILEKIGKTGISLNDFVLIHSDISKTKEGELRIYRFCADIGLIDHQIEKVIKYILEELITQKEKQKISAPVSHITILEKFNKGINSIVVVDGRAVSTKKLVFSGIDNINN